MHTTPILITTLALALAAPLSASAETAQKKVHAVNLKTRVAAAKPAATAAATKEAPVKMRMPQQEPAPVETVYDYASCGCS